MERRRLGQSNLFVSKMALGCMSLGTDENKALTILEEAFDRGINYFDTADLYDFGENEKIVGKFIKGKRDQVIVATKVGNRWNETKDSWYWDPSKKYIMEAVEHSLRRLNTDYIDLYQLHGGTIEDRIEETIEAFEKLKEKGYIRYYGISSIRPNVIREYVKKSNIISVMMQYSILDRRPEESILSLLHEHGVGGVARGSVAKGLLTDQGEEKAAKIQAYLDYEQEELITLINELKELSKGRSLTEIALHYNLAHPAIASCVVGVSSVEQLRENIEAIESASLTADIVDKIRAISKGNRYEAHR